MYTINLNTNGAALAADEPGHSGNLYKSTSYCVEPPDKQTTMTFKQQTVTVPEIHFRITTNTWIFV